MIYYDRIDVSEGVDFNKTSGSKDFFFFFFFFLSIWVFFHEHSWITGLQGKGEGILLTPHYHFHSLHRH